MDLRELVADRRFRTRVALSLGILAGLLTVVFYALFRPSPDNTFDVFYAAATSSFAGEIVYQTEHGLYVYTPVVLLGFYPYALLFEFQNALLVHRLLTLAAAGAYGATLAWFLAQRVSLSRADRLLVVGFVAVSLYPIVITVLGGVEVFLGAALGVGWILMEHRRDVAGGALWAGAALVKVFPALWGLYLLRRRNLRAVAGAVATGVGATLLGVLVFGVEAYTRYFEIATGSRVRVEMFAGGASPDNEAVTPIRPLAQLFPNVDPHVWPPIIAAVTALLVLAIYVRVPTDDLSDRATVLLATVVGITFVMPTSQDLDMYLVYAPLVVLLYTERRALVHALYSVGAVVLVYNFSQNELRPVLGRLGAPGDAAMAVLDPVLTFATMPLYGLALLFAGCLLRAWRADWAQAAAVRDALD